MVDKDRETREGTGDMTVREAGHLGGEATSRTHGHEFYSEIGHKGGEIGGPKVARLIEEGKEAENEQNR
ncbi:MAG TPA: KGG domain-containing protein [Oscillatoriaceae cyanobacterium]